MFRSKTVFVLGAGASHEVGLPVGDALAQKITNMLGFRFEHFTEVKAGDAQIAHTLIRQFRQEGDEEVNAYISGGRRISEGLPFVKSIDTFMHQHSSDKYVQQCGKLAIVKSILEAEKSSHLWIDQTERDACLNPAKVIMSWYWRFFRMLNDGVPKEQIADIFKQVSFINFNYDRCLKVFLVEALRIAYAIKHEEAQEIVGSLREFHPYGSVGVLPWEKHGRAVEFGGNHGLMELAPMIRTFTERITDDDELARMREEMKSAQTVVFLGFAFHEQNMKLIRPEEDTHIRRVFATAVGFSDPDVEVVTKLIRQTLRSRVSMHVHVRSDRKCAALFDEYQFTFAQG